MLRSAVVALLTLAMAPRAIAWAGEPQGQDVPPAEASTAETVPVDTDKTLRMTVNVAIDGRGPYSFMVDTGAHRSAIARELADQLALKPGSSIKLQTMSGTKTVNTSVIPRLTINSLEVTKIQAATLDQDNMGAAGLIGIDALKSRRVLLDFRASTMVLTPSIKLKKEWNDNFDGETIIVTAHERFGQLILTKATVDDDQVDVIIDTGLEVSLGNEALRRRLFARGGSIPGKWQSITLVGVTGEAIQVDSTTVDRLRIANMGITNLPLAFSDAHPFVVLGLVRKPALMLGMDVLRLFDQVSLDFRTKEVGFRWSNKQDQSTTTQSSSAAAENAAGDPRAPH